MAALLLGGCAGQTDREAYLTGQLERVRADAAADHARVAELEQRLGQLERERQIDRAAPNANLEVTRRLDQLIAINERALAQPPAPAAPEAQPEAQPAAQEPSPEQQLRALVEKLRGRSDRFHGPLTRQQNEALRVLLKPERQLDRENPWVWY